RQLRAGACGRRRAYQSRTAQARRHRAAGRRRRLARMAARHDWPARREPAVYRGAHRRSGNMTRASTGTTAHVAEHPPTPVLAVVGVGLIGGSAALALRSAGQVGRVLGVGRNAQSLACARELGIIDAAATLQQAAEQADVILLATPVGG